MALSREVKVGAFVAAGLVVAGLVVFLIGDERRAFTKKDRYYAVFADVSSSASVIQAIAAAPCTLVVSNGVPLGDGSCVPIPNVVVTSATQIQ